MIDGEEGDVDASLSTSWNPLAHSQKKLISISFQLSFNTVDHCNKVLFHFDLDRPRVSFQKTMAVHTVYRISLL